MIFDKLVKKNAIKMSNKFYSEEILSSYDKSFAELEKIEKKLDGPITSVDEMSELAQRCLPLIQTCKAKLKETEGYVNAVLEETN